MAALCAAAEVVPPLPGGFTLDAAGAARRYRRVDALHGFETPSARWTAHHPQCRSSSCDMSEGDGPVDRGDPEPGSADVLERVLTSGDRRRGRRVEGDLRGGGRR